MSTTPNPPSQRTLRLINLITFLPAFIMLLIHGIISGSAIPAVALIPLALSALLALYILNPNAVTAGGSAIQIAHGHLAAIDVILAVWLFIMCVCCWKEVPRYRYDGGQIMLGTYGSVWIMLNCGIHAYVAVLRLPDLIALFAAPCPECGKMGTHSHSRGQRKFQVENGYVKLAREERLPLYQGDEASSGTSTPAK